MASEEFDNDSPQADDARAKTPRRTQIQRLTAIGLATLLTAVLVWTGTQTSQAGAFAAASEPEAECLAELHVTRAPLDATIRVHTLERDASFPPMMARGSEALFSGLPCHRDLLVMVQTERAGAERLTKIPISHQALVESDGPLEIPVSEPLSVSALDVVAEGH
jgi:hypothetical protein